MRLYLVPVMGLCFAVDGLLLAGAARLTSAKLRWEQTVLAAALGALYGGACLLPELRFLGSAVWRLVSLAVMGLVTFGVGRQALGRTALFLVLNMASGALSLALGGEQTMLASAVIVCLLCLLSLRGRPGKTVPVTLYWQGRQEKVLALRDTGNTLRDPLTGEQVLIASAQVAQSLLGVEASLLNDPVQAMVALRLPGLRLIPYTAVGGRGMLLGIRLDCVQLGERQDSMVVAFAPTGLDGKYQALTGGTV